VRKKQTRVQGQFALGLFVVWNLLLVVSGCRSTDSPRVQVGADRLLTDYRQLVAGKTVGLITNQTGVDSRGRHIADLLADDPEVTLGALFGPEHGIRGQAEAGASVENGKDVKTGVPIFSLYGKTKKPTPEMLKGLDVLIFDIQDVGARFYTFISTMSLAMEAAAENGIPFVVLDRPNPIGGTLVEGPMLDPRFRSFVGIHPIPLRHGMTVGELARLFNEQGWLKNGVRADLHVVPLRGWKRAMLYDETGLKWIPPSPNMPSPETALLYPGMGLLEATNISEGRGTHHPFENVGAPWIDPEQLIQQLSAESIPGLQIRATTFTPVDLPGMAMNPKYEGRLCRGLWLDVTDGHRFRSAEFGLRLIAAVRQLYPDSLQIRERGMNLMSGRAEITRALQEGAPLDSLLQLQREGVADFLKLRQKALLYR